MPDESANIAEAEPDTGVAAEPQTAVDAAPETVADTAPDAQQSGQEAAPSDGTAKPTAGVTLDKQEPQKPQTHDWEKRYRDLQSTADRWRNETGTKLQQLQQEREQLLAFKKEQEQIAAKANLKPWSKQHPEHNKFTGLLERAKTVEQQIRAIPKNLPPEQQEMMQNAIVSALSPDEQNQLREYREQTQNFQRDWFADPHGTLMPMFNQFFEQKMAEYQQVQQSRMEVQKDFEDPSLKPLIEQHGQELKKALDDGVPYTYAKHMMSMFDRLQKAEAELAKTKGVTEQAKEQQRLAKGEAAITRDTKANKPDAYEMAKRECREKGIPTTGKRFFDILHKYETQH